MSNSNSGCLGCLSTLFIVGCISSFFLGGGILVRVGSWSFGLGKALMNPEYGYLDDLESNRNATEEAVQNFRQLLEQGKCHEIYSQSNEAFKQSLSQVEMANLCKKMKQEVGTIKSSQITDAWMQPAEETDNQYILLRYTSTSSKFLLRETFVWLVGENQPELVQYEVFPQSISAQSSEKVQSW